MPFHRGPVDHADTSWYATMRHDNAFAPYSQNRMDSSMITGGHRFGLLPSLDCTVKRLVNADPCQGQGLGALRLASILLGLTIAADQTNVYDRLIERDRRTGCYN
jgi:hypothetical protein